MVHVWHRVGVEVVGEGGRAIGHTWEWVGAKRGEESKRESRARQPIQWQHCVSLQNVSKLILSHFPLALSIFPSSNPPFSLSYRPISIIRPPSPHLLPHSTTFAAWALNRSPHQLSFSPHPTFFLLHQAERLHYSWPKIVLFLSSPPPPRSEVTLVLLQRRALYCFLQPTTSQSLSMTSTRHSPRSHRHNNWT